MALNQFIINADIIDIKIDKPNANDIFLVDSHKVWYWLTYSNASKASNPPVTVSNQSLPYLFEQNTCNKIKTALLQHFNC